MELDNNEWEQIKAIIKSARTLVRTYEHGHSSLVQGHMFDSLKKAINIFDADSPLRVGNRPTPSAPKEKKE